MSDDAYAEIKLYRCVYCGHQQPGPEDGFDACEECDTTDGLEPMDEDEAAQAAPEREEEGSP